MVFLLTLLMQDRRFRRRDPWEVTDISLKQPIRTLDQFLNVRGCLIRISVKRMTMPWPMKVLEHVFLRRVFKLMYAR